MPLDLLQLRRLAIFAIVAEQGGFARASEKLGVSRSSISEQVKLLEESLGQRLLHRTTRHVSVTTEGNRLLGEASTIVGALQRIDDLAGLDEPAGRVRITTVEDIATHWLAPQLNDLSTRYPDISFDLIMTDTLLDLVENRIDLAIRGVAEAADSSLISRHLVTDSAILVAAPGYLKARGTPLDLADLARHSWVLLNQFSKDGSVSMLSDGEPHRFVPRQAHLSSSPTAIRAMIGAGLGIGFDMPIMVRDRIERGELVHLLPSWRGASFSFSLLYPSRHHLPARVGVVVDHLMVAAKLWRSV